MKICIVSYSLSGNSDALAKSIAQRIGAEHIAITAPQRSHNGNPRNRITQTQIVQTAP